VDNAKDDILAVGTMETLVNSVTGILEDQSMKVLEDKSLVQTS